MILKYRACVIHRFLLFIRKGEGIVDIAPLLNHIDKKICHMHFLCFLCKCLRILTQLEFLESFKQTDIPGIVSDNAEITSRELSSPENYLHLENYFNYP